MASAKVECLFCLLTLAVLEASQDYGSSVLEDGVALIQVGSMKQSTEQVAELQQEVRTVTSIPAKDHKIYTYWHYPDGPSPWIKLNVQSWLKHAPPGTELVLVNESNFRDLIPDAPKELFMLPYSACKSDVVRAAVLYHHGGIYLDTDFVVMKPLSPILAKLGEGWDVVAHSDENSDSGWCFKNEFTSNFMAARRGNEVSGTWWENIKAKLTRICGFGEYSQEKVCCHEAFADEEPAQCHVPWGQLEWLKNPEKDADVFWDSEPKVPKGVHGPVLDAMLEAIERGNAKAKQLPPQAPIFCLQGHDALQPHLNGEIYWQKWDSKTQATSADAAKASKDDYDVRFQCQESGNGDLRCERGNWGNSTRTFRNFFGRTAYHLFFSTKLVETKTPEEALASDWLVAELLRRSLGNKS